MRIAMPVTDGLLSSHFGHCQQFAFYDVDQENKKTLTKEFIDSPPHNPGLLPGWVKENGGDIVIAGGMGQRAQQLFTMQGIEVLIGIPPGDPEKIVELFLDGGLRTGDNLCDSSHDCGDH